MTNRSCALFLIFVAIASCQPKKKENKARQEKDDAITRSYSKEGKLLSEVAAKDGLRDGISKTYYSNGKVSLEISYKAGKKEGWSKRYYETGILFQETEYKDNKKNGILKKYWESGKLLSEEHYVNDFACNSLKEYLEDGTVKSGYPQIIITPVDRLKQDGTFVLNLSLSNKSKRVKFYKGRLSSEGCLSDALEPLFFDSKTGIGQARYFLSPNEFKMEEVHVIAAVGTSNGNTFIAQGSYNLSIQN